MVRGAQGNNTVIMNGQVQNSNSKQNPSSNTNNNNFGNNSRPITGSLY